MLFGTQTINARGHLEIGGCDSVDLAERFGTPLYVVDEAAFESRCREYHESFRAESPDTIVAFATKAFLCKAAARLAAGAGLHIDVASTGELLTVEAAGVPLKAVTFHGNYKKDEDIVAGLERGVGQFVLDSIDECRRVDVLARERGMRQRALLRVAPGIDAHTLDAISTGRNDTKFGVTVENGAALATIREILTLEGIELVGLHAHIGSQILELEPFELLARTMVRLLANTHKETGWSARVLVLGGGLGIHYDADDRPPAVADLARTLIGTVRKECVAAGLELPAVGVEPGRSLIGEFGSTLYRVGPVKTVPTGEGSTRTYVAIDGGLSDNPRPVMYDATYPVLLANRANESSSVEVRISGRHCETDKLFDVKLPTPRSGDLVAVLSTGAYNHVMASNYNSFYRPPIVFVRDGKAREVVRRETQADLLARDLG